MNQTTKRVELGISPRGGDFREDGMLQDGSLKVEVVPRFRARDFRVTAAMMGLSTWYFSAPEWGTFIEPEFQADSLTPIPRFRAGTFAKAAIGTVSDTVHCRFLTLG